MKKSRIPSPARSMGHSATPRRHKTRASRSVGSPARPSTSGVHKFQEDNMDSFVLSPMNRNSVLSDNTDVELPRRKSWWKKLKDDSGDIMEVVHKNPVDEVENVLDDYLDEDTLTQEKLDYIMDIPESSGSESISSIVLPQRRLFTHKEIQLQNNLWPNVKSREALAKLDKTKVEDKTLHVKAKKLFGQEQRKKKRIFSEALITSPNKTLLNDELTNFGPKKLFCQEPSKKKRSTAIPSAGVHDSEKEEALAKVDETGVEDKTLPVKAKKLFGQEQQRGKPVFPKALITSPNKTLPNDELTYFGPKKLFSQQPSKKTKSSMFPSALENEANEPGTSGHRNVIGKPMFSSTLIASPNKTFSNFELSNVEAEKIFRQELAKRKSAFLSSTDHDLEKETNEPGTSEHRNLFGQLKKRTEFNFPALSIEHSMADEEQANTSGVKVDEQNELEQLTRNEDQNQQEEEKIEQSVREDENNVENQENIDENRSVVEDAKENEQSNEKDEQEKESIEIEHYEQGKENSKDIDQSAEEHEKDERFQIKQTVEENKETDKQSFEVSVELNEDVQKHCDEMDQDNQIIEDETRTHQISIHLENEENIHTKDVPNYIDQLPNVTHDTTGQNIKAGIESKANSPEVKLQQPVEKDKEIYENQRDKEGDRSFVGDAEQNKQSDEEINKPEDGSIEIERHEEHDEQAEENYEDISQSVVEEQQKQHEESDYTYVEENEEDENNDQLLAKVQENENEEFDDHNIEENDGDMEENHENSDMSVAEEQENEESNDQYVEDIDENVVEEDGNNDQSVTKEQENEHEESDDISVAEEQYDEHEESDNVNLEVETERNDHSNEEDEYEQENYEEMDQDDQETEGDISDEEEEFEQESYEELDQEDQEIEGDSETNKQITRSSENEENTRTEESHEVINESRDVTHDTTGRNRKKIYDKTKVQSPEDILKNKTNLTHSFVHRGRNTSIRETKGMTAPDLRPSLAAGVRDSIGTTGSNSSAQGSGWDSHRNERKTLRQTFGRDFTPRKSLRTLVMEKSAKHRTLPEVLHVESPQANSVEINMNFTEPSVSNYVEEESNHDVSKAARLADLEARLDKVKDEIIARKQRTKEKVEQSLKAPRQNFFTNFKMPLKPGFGARKGLATSMAKSKPKFSNALLSALPPSLRKDLNYKPPKRFNKASWCTKRLYKFLETKLEPKYDYKARVRAEALVEKLFYFGKSITKCEVASQESIDDLKHEMARLKIVKTHHEFYNFFKEYLPREIRIKVVPDCANKIPVPEDVFGDILKENVRV